jgi:hypothetical protein
MKYRDEAINLYKNFDINKYNSKEEIINKIKELSSLAEKM